MQLKSLKHNSFSLGRFIFMESRLLGKPENNLSPSSTPSRTKEIPRQRYPPATRSHYTWQIIPVSGATRAVPLPKPQLAHSPAGRQHPGCARGQSVRLQSRLCTRPQLPAGSLTQPHCPALGCKIKQISPSQQETQHSDPGRCPS